MSLLVRILIYLTPPSVAHLSALNKDARWFTREEVRAVLNHSSGTQFKKSDYKRMNDILEGKSTDDKKTIEATAQALSPSGAGQIGSATGDTGEDGEPPFRLPPLSAIAGVLIRDWVDGKIGFAPSGVQVKQNL